MNGPTVRPSLAVFKSGQETVPVKTKKVTSFFLIRMSAAEMRSFNGDVVGLHLNGQPRQGSNLEVTGTTLQEMVSGAPMLTGKI